MGVNIDATMVQSKMLNTGKGPAIQSLRAQADKKEYHAFGSCVDHLLPVGSRVCA